QLDRFLMKIVVTYPELEEEKQILRRFQGDFSLALRRDVQRVMTPKDILQCRKLIEETRIEETLLDYIAHIVHQTRNHRDIYLGASPRASLAILKTSKAIAAMQGRDFVTPEDIQLVAYPVLIHRLILQPEREMEGMGTEDAIRNIIQGIEVPR
ncbi:MAG: AAA family ATPase, partial [Haliscomenobacter sp.]